MKTFTIEIKETLLKTIEIEAVSIGEAVSQTETMYNNENIILNSSDHNSTEFDISNLESLSENIAFSNFVLKKAEEMLLSLSIEELAKIGFGSLINAKEVYEK